MNQTREKLRSLNLHLTKKHEVARKKRMMLLVGDLSLKEQEFLELFSETVFCQHWRLPFYRCLLRFLWQEVSSRERAFEGFKHYQLKQYIWIHTKEKPYNCKTCQCKFRLKYHIHCHKRTKHWHEKRFLL